MLPHHPLLMEGLKSTLFVLAYLLFCFSDTTPLMVDGQLLPIVDDDEQGGNAGGMRTYIVHVDEPEGSQFLGHQGLEGWHRSFLPNTTLDSGKPRLVYSYRHAISGFAARLTPEEVKAMEAMDGFVHAEPDRMQPLATTYTPHFLGLSQPNGAWSSPSAGEGVIIGVLDTGILPTHPSFNAEGMPPPPAKWKGRCGFQNFSCNNKIIGGAAFRGADENKHWPIDDQGHGTHVAGTAAGRFVNGANFLGMTNGTASGMAPKAHLAIYKVCFAGRGCASSDILAAIDQAIDDGVDLITMSIGGKTEKIKIYRDSVALGSLSAINHGITATTSAGNNGPGAGKLSHTVPWVLTVGAVSTDRKIAAIVKLGNGVELIGQSAYQPHTSDSFSMLPIVYPGANGNKKAKYCLGGSLDNFDVKGKVVLCLVGSIANVEKGKVVYAAGGAAMIVMNQQQQGYTTSPNVHVLPASNVNYVDGLKIRSYINSTTDPAPTATIVFNGTQFGYRPSPGLGYFSSRGPSTGNGGILKPDVVAPGVDIIAAWPFELGPNPTGSTSTFSFQSGTSMAAPHVAGIIALVKSKHRSWSPAAIQSAIITSARELDLNGNIIVDEINGDAANIFSIGAGLVNPLAAIDPGLVYDANPDEYVRYVCSLGYTDKEVQATVRRPVQCSKVGKIKAWELNYPSISLPFGPKFKTATLRRTVTNVGEANSVYRARITAPTGVQVQVSPSQLHFTKVKLKASFNVTLTITGSNIAQLTRLGGKLEWVSHKHVVASPIAVLYSP